MRKRIESVLAGAAGQGVHARDIASVVACRTRPQRACLAGANVGERALALQ
ncbi:MAG TPA: hypothetical protein VN750_14755 [Steroidobacteraceae bacterium]|nr:hypothetical protein [Steroidobacteraceae bacterium]